MKKNFLCLIATAILLLGIGELGAQNRTLTLLSPDARTRVEITVGQYISYSITQNSVEMLAPSRIAMTISDSLTWGVASSLSSVESISENKIIDTPFYKSAQITDHYNGLLMNFDGSWALEFRAYDDAVAYRFISMMDGEYHVDSEIAEFKFAGDYQATFPYVASAGDLEHQLFQSFENIYTSLKVSEIDKNRLMFLPLSVEVDSGHRVTITESNLRDYPGMYLRSSFDKDVLSGYFAPVRNEVEPHSGYNNLQVVVKSRHNYIAEVDGPRTFPWRVVIVTDSDVELANTSVVYKLADENVLEDISWIKPGKVAWDWWNNWNLEGVDFKAGVNNQTYKYFIDFAAENGIEYVILDEGWSVNKVYDLMQVVPEIDIKKLVDYGSQRGVDIILWAGYYAFDKDMEAICKYYSELGVKGFKVDFMNGDDQELVSFNERVAKTTAKYNLIADIHGTYKPTGLERTYPNLLNFEGVHGLEQMKWQPDSIDQVSYDVTMPFLRMVAGPVDYTQGAMTNAVRAYNSLADTIENQYYPSFTKPMSQGTRMRQLAQYVVFFSPLNMLSDSPSAYIKNPVSTEFIASVPTVWDFSQTIEGVMGEYIVTVRRSGDKWYIAGLNNWDIRTITVDVEAITGKKGRAVLYKDGPNADINGADFSKQDISISAPLEVTMAAGGGFVIVI
ncbi:MAG: glycoside hydrolase family 97 protein [Rikenellaceae bacterium]